MLSRPRYQADVAMASDEWMQQYLEVDVERLQQHKQHHVHLPPDFPGGPRKPLAHCRDAKDPMKCKAGFPRTAALIDEPVV
eukprot:1204227-Amphidinium_carterae.1